MRTTSWQFGRLGAAIGFKPFFFIFFSFLILIPGFYGLFFRRLIHLGIDEGFTRLDAPSRREISYQKAFFGANDSAVPWYLATFAVPRFENGSMMEDAEFSELLDFYTKVTTELTFSGANGTQLTYMDICYPFCGINEMLIKGMSTPYFLVNRAYPIFDVFGFDVNIGKFIFMRNTSKNGELIGSKLMVMYFTVFVENEETKLQLDELDKKVIALCEVHNKNPKRKIDIILHGNYPVQLEVERGFQETMPLVFGGILIGFFVFGFTILLSAKLFRQCGWQIGIWILCSILVVIFSILGALGSTCLLGMSINVTVAMTPFVSITVILNSLSIYQITDIWHRITAGLVKKTHVIMVEAAEFGKKTNNLKNGNSVICRATKQERMAHLFEQISKNFLTFFFASTVSLWTTAYFAIPNFQMAFTFFGFTVFYLSILQISLFCPIMMLTSRRPPDFEDACSSSRKISLTRKIKKFFVLNLILPYSKFLKTSFGKFFFVFVFFTGFLWPSIYGIRNIQNSMDFKRIMPDDSPNLRAFGFMDQHVWNDFLQFVFIVRNPPKFDDPEQFGPFKKMVHELENLPTAFGPESNMMWLFDYSNFELNKEYHKTDFKFINMSKFFEFITTEPYNAWNDGVKWKITDPGTNETEIEEMLFMVTFRNITSLQGKLETLTACRAILEQYPQFDVASFDTDSATVDTILSVPPTLISVVLSFIILTALVSCFTIQNVVGTALTTLFTASTICGIFGFSYFVNIQLDPLGVGTYIFSFLIGNLLVGQAVSTYLRHRSEPNRLQMTLERLSCQAVKLLALVLVFSIPVMFGPVFIHRSNIQILLLSVSVSLVHVTFFIPAALNLFPTALTGEACCYDSE